MTNREAMSRGPRNLGVPPWVWVTALLLLGVSVSLGRNWLPESGSPDRAMAITVGEGEAAVLELFESRRSGEMVVVAGIVDGVLPDDDTGSRHQRFIVRMESGHILLVAHNIDLARRVPLRAGDQVRVRGEYEWNDEGGVLHWTHHDPAGNRPGGWIVFNGDEYR